MFNGPQAQHYKVVRDAPVGDFSFTQTTAAEGGLKSHAAPVAAAADFDFAEPPHRASHIAGRAHAAAATVAKHAPTSHTEDSQNSFAHTKPRYGRPTASSSYSTSADAAFEFDSDDDDEGSERAYPRAASTAAVPKSSSSAASRFRISIGDPVAAAASNARISIGDPVTTASTAIAVDDDEADDEYDDYVSAAVAPVHDDAAVSATESIAGGDDTESDSDAVSEDDGFRRKRKKTATKARAKSKPARRPAPAPRAGAKKRKQPPAKSTAIVDDPEDDEDEANIHGNASSYSSNRRRQRADSESDASACIEIDDDDDDDDVSNCDDDFEDGGRRVKNKKQKPAAASAHRGAGGGKRAQRSSGGAVSSRSAPSMPAPPPAPKMPRIVVIPASGYNRATHAVPLGCCVHIDALMDTLLCSSLQENMVAEFKNKATLLSVVHSPPDPYMPRTRLPHRLRLTSSAAPPSSDIGVWSGSSAPESRCTTTPAEIVRQRNGVGEAALVWNARNLTDLLRSTKFETPALPLSVVKSGVATPPKLAQWVLGGGRAQIDPRPPSFLNAVVKEGAFTDNREGYIPWVLDIIAPLPQPISSTSAAASSSVTTSAGASAAAAASDGCLQCFRFELLAMEGDRGIVYVCGGDAPELESLRSAMAASRARARSGIYSYDASAPSSSVPATAKGKKRDAVVAAASVALKGAADDTSIGKAAASVAPAAKKPRRTKKFLAAEAAKEAAAAAEEDASAAAEDNEFEIIDDDDPPHAVSGSRGGFSHSAATAAAQRFPSSAAATSQSSTATHSNSVADGVAVPVRMSAVPSGPRVMSGGWMMNK